jgi:hypothetical protein
LSLVILLTGPVFVWAGAPAFEPALLELGELRTGHSLERKVILRNDGATPLEISSLTGSCGCLQIKPFPRSVAAGGRVEIGLVIHTLSANAGDQTWHVRAACRQDGQERLVTLPVRTRIVREVVVQPPLLRVSSAGPTKHEITITDRRPRTFKILKAEATSPHLELGAVTEQADAEGRPVRRLALTLGESLPPGQYEEQVILHTDDPLHRELRVLVGITRKKLERIEVFPPSLEVVLSPALPTATRAVTLRDRKGQPTIIERVDSPHDAVTCILPSGPAAMATLRITFDEAKLKDDGWRGELLVHLREPAGEKARIPLSVLKR